MFVCLHNLNFVVNLDLLLYGDPSLSYDDNTVIIKEVHEYIKNSNRLT